MIVMKFGGTSVESVTAIERVAGIVRDHLDRRPVVVVSAVNGHHLVAEPPKRLANLGTGGIL